MKKIFEAMFATHEALRRLGFTADDIYVAWVAAKPGGPPRPATELRAQGLRFMVDYPLIPDFPTPFDQFAKEYQEAAAEYVSFSQEAGEANYRKYYDLAELTNLGTLLLSKGFTVPHRAVR